MREVWLKDFGKQNKGVTVDHQAKSSGARIQDFTNRTVDFAGSDAAMTAEEIAKVADGVILLPVTAGEIVLAYNLPVSPKGLKLPRDVYPDIFLGKVTKWNDPRIAAANPNLKLPDLLITVVRRSDSSGTTLVLTEHLSAISEAFAKEIGSGTTVQWSIFIAELSTLFRRLGCEKVAPAGQFERTGRGPVTCPP